MGKVPTNLNELQNRIEEQFGMIYSAQTCDALITKLTQYLTFTDAFNTNIALKIVESFEYILNEEEFEDVDAIQQDIGNMQENVIIPYVMEQIEPLLSDKDNNEILNGIKCEIQETVQQGNEIMITKDNMDDNSIDKFDRFPTLSFENSMVTRESIFDCIIYTLMSLRKSEAAPRHKI